MPTVTAPQGPASQPAPGTGTQRTGARTGTPAPAVALSSKPSFVSGPGVSCLLPAPGKLRETDSLTCGKWDKMLHVPDEALHLTCRSRNPSGSETWEVLPGSRTCENDSCELIPPYTFLTAGRPEVTVRGGKKVWMTGAGKLKMMMMMVLLKDDDRIPWLV